MLKPAEADASEARAHISVIQAEKEAAQRKQEENERLCAVKYVSGGITRVKWGTEPAWMRRSGGIHTLYMYGIAEDPFTVNAFVMPN